MNFSKTHYYYKTIFISAYEWKGDLEVFPEKIKQSILAQMDIKSLPLGSFVVYEDDKLNIMTKESFTHKYKTITDTEVKLLTCNSGNISLSI
jgi:hypothetical protein